LIDDEYKKTDKNVKDIYILLFEFEIYLVAI